MFSGLEDILMGWESMWLGASMVSELGEFLWTGSPFGWEPMCVYAMLGTMI